MSGLGSSPETQNKISKANSSNDMLTKVSGDFKTNILLQFCIRIFKKMSMIFKAQAHFGTRVRIMKRRVRTAAMPFLLSVLVLCLSKHCMLVQLLRVKVAALSI